MKVCKAPKRLHQVDQSSDMDLDNLFVGDIQIDSLQDDKETRSEIVTNIPVVTKPYHTRYSKVAFKVDTGAQANVLPKWQYQQLFHHITS